MNNRFLTQSLTFAIFLFLITASLHAQVTIGSANPPMAGAILDLTQGASTTKGLNLPRVKLSDINKLKIGDNEILDTDNQYAEHTGLVVYVVKSFGSSPINPPGIYVWSGSKWELLGEPTYAKKPDITMTDADGNVYNARWFTTDPYDSTVGAYWTTSNLYSTQKGSGGAFADPGYGVSANEDKPRINVGYYYYGPTDGGYFEIAPGANLGSYNIPANTYGLGSTSAVNLNNPAQTYKEFAKEYGLLYNQSQAMSVCPTGWHLPSADEWAELIVALGGESVAGNKMRKSSVWQWYYLPRDGEPHIWGGGDSGNLPQSEASGFDAVPSGVVVDPNATGTLVFGEITIWRSGTNDFCYSLEGFNPMITQESGLDPAMFFSVRCVQN